MKIPLIYFLFFTLVLQGQKLESKTYIKEIDQEPISNKTKNPTSTFNKNALHFNLGVQLLVSATVLVNYDRLIFENQKLAFFLRGGYGRFTYYQDKSTERFLQYQLVSVFGKKDSHFEASLGFLSNLNRDQELLPRFSLAGSVNYRYQDPRGPFLFRIGIGRPETIFLGLGIAF